MGTAATFLLWGRGHPIQMRVTSYSLSLGMLWRPGCYAAKCNINPNCNKLLNAKCNNFLNMNCKNFLTQGVTTCILGSGAVIAIHRTVLAITNLFMFLFYFFFSGSGVGVICYCCIKDGAYYYINTEVFLCGL